MEQAIRAMFSDGTAEYRIPAELYYVEKYKTSEIARILRLPEGTVKRRLHTARKLLKEGGV